MKLQRFRKSRLLSVARVREYQNWLQFWKKAVPGGDVGETEKKQLDAADHEISDRPVIPLDSPYTVGESNPLRFTLVSAVTADVLLACELPDWAGGLLEGRLTGLCSDLLRTISPSTNDAGLAVFPLADWD